MACEAEEFLHHIERMQVLCLFVCRMNWMEVSHRTLTERMLNKQTDAVKAYYHPDCHAYFPSEDF